MTNNVVHLPRKLWLCKAPPDRLVEEGHLKHPCLKKQELTDDISGTENRTKDGSPVEKVRKIAVELLLSVILENKVSNGPC